MIIGQLLKKIKLDWRLLLAGAVAAALVNPVTAAETASVGFIQSALGAAHIQSNQGDRQLARVDAMISVGDKIITGRNGHVHLRFVDDALVSVRPNSELIIERYEYDQQNPGLSAVKFSLNEGVARAMSGAAARSARERFRLNTPIAAIGVRGTDFIVSTNSRTTQAKVEEGMIVVAPYSADCLMDALGPCEANAVALGGDSLEMLELNEGVTTPRILPAGNLSRVGAVAGQVQAMADPGSAPVVEETVNSENGSSSNNVIVEGVTSPQLTADAEQLAAASATPANFMPERALASSELTSRQLVWGRYSEDLANRDRIAVDFGLARAEREITVGNVGYGLYRPEDGSKQVNPDLSVVSFNLAAAQAYYDSNTGIVAMDVSGGSLAVDFEDSSFATELNLSHALTGDIDFVANGLLNSNGYFYNRGDTQRIGGSVSLDGSEAGYFFEQQLDNGGIQGLTLWNR